MAEYICKKTAIDSIANNYCIDCEHSNGILCRACEHQDDMDIIDSIPTEDVISAKIVEHIKQRILETAFNNDAVYSEVAEDIVDRIDFWVKEMFETQDHADKALSLSNKHGEWVELYNYPDEWDDCRWVYKCSLCEYHIESLEDYCPNCKAKMTE